MAEWLTFSVIAVMLWRIMGFLQKVAPNHISTDSVLIWDRVGYLLLVPWLLMGASLHNMAPRDMLIGTLDGISNSLGAWFLYASLENGAKASIAIPLTSLYPLPAVLLAVIFLGEKVRPAQWVGIALALVAGVLMTLEPPTASAAEEAP